MVMHTCNPSTLETDKIFVNSLDRITVSARTVRDCETLSQNTNKMASETVQRGGRVLATIPGTNTKLNNTNSKVVLIFTYMP